MSLCSVVFLSSRLKRAINLVTIVKTQLSTIVDEIEAIKSDIGVKVLRTKTELGVDSNIAACI